MLPIPAIDIRNGRCVRLLQGDFAKETIYGDPIEQAVAFVDAGAPMLHIVDLDAARSGEATNDATVRQIIDVVGVPIQVGGGVRTRERACSLLDHGVDRVVVGTLAVEDPGSARALAEEFPSRIVVGLDHRTELIDGHRRRMVAVRGWEATGGVELARALASLAGAPFAGAVITDISRDGTLEGPDLVGYSYALSNSEIEVIASGGVGTLEDVRRLRDLTVNGRSLAGVIIGRALLSGAFDVAEVVTLCAP
jgi:phosphoribosylformimino-5-aminoimidazole carboxamide ribotide isomerase